VDNPDEDNFVGPGREYRTVVENFPHEWPNAVLRPFEWVYAVGAQCTQYTFPAGMLTVEFGIGRGVQDAPHDVIALRLVIGWTRVENLVTPVVMLG
jgi:hypothetical protein